MTKARHQTLNSLLNQAVQSSLASSYPMRFQRAQHVDSFHETGREKLRVSRDRRGEVVDVITKKRVADMNVFSPQETLDWRVSVSTENPGGSGMPGSYGLM